MERHRLKFHLKEPSVWQKALYFSYGYLPYWSPVVINSMLFDGWYQLIGYGIMGVGVGAVFSSPKWKNWLLNQVLAFQEVWNEYRVSYKLSRTLREVMENANLVTYQKKESVDRKGRRRVENITTFPAVEFEGDDYNYCLKLHMLPGQTTKQWEGKLDAFSSALRSDLVGYKISKGVVELTMQHTAMNVSEVLRKTDNEHYLYVGYKPGGVLKWNFDKLPHLLVVGVTGAGKSTFLRNLLSQIPKSWTLRIVDGKQVEFGYMQKFGIDVERTKEGFLQYVDDAVEEMERRYEYMSEKGKNHYVELEELEPYFLLCDEWISLIELLDKKGKDSERDQFFAKLRNLTTKGRAAGVFLIAVLQRPDAEFLSGIVRDMFTAKVVLKGNKTAFSMTFGDDGKELTPLETGQGYCMMDGITNFSFPDYSLESFISDLEEKMKIKVVEDVQEENAMAREADLPSPIQ